MASHLTLYNSQGEPVEITGDSVQGGAIGSLEVFAGVTAPVGYLICPDASAPDSAYPLKTAYPDLYAYIGDTWGVLGDTTRFAIPPSSKDGKGYFLRGVGNVGVGTKQDDVFKEHSHSTGVTSIVDTGSAVTVVRSSGDATRTGDFGDPTETRPMSITGLLCIKAFNSVASTGAVDVQALINALPDPRSYATAWVSFDNAGVRASNLNIVSVTKDSQGVFTCTFGTPMDNTGYTVLITGDRDGTTGTSGPLAFNFASKTINSFKVSFKTVSGSVTDIVEGNVTVHGGK